MPSEKCTIEKMMINDDSIPFTQTSDHYGVSAVLEYTSLQDTKNQNWLDIKLFK